MWQLLFGLGIGIYVGTYYDCKNRLDKIIELIQNNVPEKKN
jgi:hypothetical protein